MTRRFKTILTLTVAVGLFAWLWRWCGTFPVNYSESVEIAATG